MRGEMRVAALEMVVGRHLDVMWIDLGEEQWTRSSREERWFAQGERLCRDYLEVEEGVLVDRAGNLHLCPIGGLL